MTLGILASLSAVRTADACQPYHFMPYVLELDDSKHVFVMGAGTEDQRRYLRGAQKYKIDAYDYPKSGLYVKGDTGNPIWVWNGPLIEYDNLKRSISADGRVLLFINDMVYEKSSFLAVYRDGVKIAEYGMAAFIDSEQQLVRFRCDRASRWARNWHYDEKSGRLRVESFAGRVVDIETEKGTITASNPVVIKDLKGWLKIRNGEHLSVSKIGICERPEQQGERLPPNMKILRYMLNPVAGEFVRDEDGLTDVPAFTISEVEETLLEDGFTLQNWSHKTIRMDGVRRMIFVPMQDSADVRSHIELIDGTRLTWNIGSGAWEICAREADGEYHRVPVRNIEWLTVFNADTGA